jgi:hypothetical protein
LRQRANPALLREHGLEHGEYGIGRFGSGFVADKVSEFVTTRIHRAHVAAKVVHEDFRRIRTSVQHARSIGLFGRLFFLELVLFFFDVVEEPLHDSDVFDVVHLSVLHIALLEKAGFCRACCSSQARKSNARRLLERAR